MLSRNNKSKGTLPSPNPTIEEEEDIIYLVSGGYDHTIRFWSPHDGKCSRVIQYPNSQVNDLKISPEKNFLAAAGHQHIRLFNIQTIHNNSPEVNLEGFVNNALSIGFFDCYKRLYSGGEDCITRVWDLRTHRNQNQRMFQTRSAANAVQLNSNHNEIFVGQQLGHISIWDIRFSHALPEARIDQQHPSIATGVQSISLNPTENVLAAIDNVGRVHIYYPAQSLTFYRSWKAHSKYGLNCLFSPNGEYLVTTSADHTAKVWKTCDILSLDRDVDQQDETQHEQQNLQELDANLQTQPQSEPEQEPTQPQKTDQEPCPQTQNPQSPANSSSSSPPRSQASYSTTSTLEPYKILKAENQRWVWAAEFSADSQFIVTASSDSVVRLWHLDSAEIRREYTGHQKAVTALAFSD